MGTEVTPLAASSGRGDGSRVGESELGVLMGAGPEVILPGATLQDNNPLGVTFPGISHSREPLLRDYDPPGPSSWVFTFPGHPVSVEGSGFHSQWTQMGDNEQSRESWWTEGLWSFLMGPWIYEEGLGITLPRGWGSSLSTGYGWAKLEVLGGQKRHCVTLRGHPPDIPSSVEEPRLIARELRSWDSHICSWLYPSSSLRPLRDSAL